jgi:diguanylate cyclase (GGDEF)-like protein
MLALKASLDQNVAARFNEIDQVTWLYNRHHFIDRLGEEIARADRYNRPLSIVMVDIDGFTAFNESYGPSMGDKLLRSVAMTLTAPLVEPEIAARYGNDEFALLLPESNRATAVTLASRLQRRSDRWQCSGERARRSRSPRVSRSFAIQKTASRKRRSWRRRTRRSPRRRPHRTRTRWRSSAGRVEPESARLTVDITLARRASSALLRRSEEMSWLRLSSLGVVPFSPSSILLCFIVRAAHDMLSLLQTCGA